MAVDAVNDKYSVKNLLFYRAIPNYVPPESASHNLYACKDCGDRFILESSYQYHIQRKSVLITYKCRHCSPRIIFHNRCNLLSHIRSHTFKTATINVSDLKIDPLPLFLYKSLKKDELPNPASIQKSKQKQNFCFECKMDISNIGPIYKDRASHYMEYTNKVYSCPVCLFTLPTSCGLKTHLRIHLKIAPFYCPECGIHLSNKSVIYPYNHSCEGFNMMRATTRNLCQVPNCMFFHPNDFKKHMKDKHLKKIYSCPACVVACFNETTMHKHISTTHKENHEDPLIFYQCELCPGRLVMQNHLDNHVTNNHKRSIHVYPCWVCSTYFKEIPDLINHHLQQHDHNEELKNCLMNLETSKKVYRVVKRCDKCMRNFTYKCHFEDIKILPNTCPFKCSPVTKSLLKKDDSSKKKIKCPLCKSEISENWFTIKKHFAIHHKEQKCLDARINLQKLSVEQFFNGEKKKRNKLVKGNIKKRSSKENKKKITLNKTPKVCVSSMKNVEISDPYACVKCQDVHESKEELEAHIAANHKDPCMAYQCLECGDCFIVKSSFSIHLLFHGISDVEEYINKKNCFDLNALNKGVTEDVIEEPIDDNQCRICRERFDDTDDLKKHFRVHGMAFLKTNSLSKPVS